MQITYLLLLALVREDLEKVPDSRADNTFHFENHIRCDTKDTLFQLNVSSKFIKPIHLDNYQSDIILGFNTTHKHV